MPRLISVAPGPFMDAAVSALHDIGMEHGHIHVERFCLAAGRGQCGRSGTGQHRCDRQPAVGAPGREEYEVPCAEGETLLNAMHRAGLERPAPAWWFLRNLHVYG